VRNYILILLALFPASVIALADSRAPLDPVRTDAIVQAVAAQRDEANNRAAMLAGDLATARAEIERMKKSCGGSDATGAKK
jgi:hypothetical protein